VALILPRYHLFNTDPTPLPVPEGNEFEVCVAPCAWLPGMKLVWSLLHRLDRWPKLAYVPRWISGWITWTLLTGSLVLAAMRLRRRRREGFDLVYAHCEYAALAGYVIRLMWRIPNVTRLYGTFVADLMKKPLVWLRYPIAAGGFLVPHRLLICANDGTRGDEVARRLRLDISRFRFWQDGVDRPPPVASSGREDILSWAPANLRADSLWILSCSRLSYWKRIDRILRAIEIAKRQGCDCQAIVAGDGPEQDRLHALVEVAGLQQEVVWLGPVPHDNIWRLMNVADVFVIANDVTNRCNPLFEAILAGLPVVSVRDSATADLLTDGKNALLAERDDGDKLGQCLVRVCKDRVLAGEMRQAQHGRDALLWNWKERMEVEVRDIEALLATTSAAAKCMGASS